MLTEKLMYLFYFCIVISQVTLVKCLPSSEPQFLAEPRLKGKICVHLGFETTDVEIYSSLTVIHLENVVS